MKSGFSMIWFEIFFLQSPGFRTSVTEDKIVLPEMFCHFCDSTKTNMNWPKQSNYCPLVLLCRTARDWAVFVSSRSLFADITPFFSKSELAVAEFGKIVEQTLPLVYYLFFSLQNISYPDIISLISHSVDIVTNWIHTPSFRNRKLVSAR